MNKASNFIQRVFINRVKYIIEYINRVWFGWLVFKHLKYPMINYSSTLKQIIHSINGASHLGG